MGFEAEVACAWQGGRFGRLPLFSEERNSSYRHEIHQIAADGSVTFELEKNIMDLDDSVQLREAWRSSDTKQRAEFEEKMDAAITGGNGKLLAKRMDGREQRCGRMTQSSKALRPDMYPVVDGMMILDLSEFSRTDNEYVIEKRLKPMFFPANLRHENAVTFRAPTGFTFAHIPKGFDYDNGIFRVTRELTQAGNSELTVKDTIWFRRKELPVTEYARIRKFYDELPGKTRQRVIIKKVE